MGDVLPFGNVVLEPAGGVSWVASTKGAARVSLVPPELAALGTGLPAQKSELELMLRVGPSSESETFGGVLNSLARDCDSTAGCTETPVVRKRHRSRWLLASKIAARSKCPT